MFDAFTKVIKIDAINLTILLRKTIFMRYIYSIILLLLVTCTLLVGCAVQPIVDNQKQTLIPVKVQTLPYLSFAPFFIAQEEGYFAEQGLEVEFVRFQRSSEAIPALLQGELDVVSGAISFGLLNAIDRSSAIKLVADKGYAAVEGCADLTILGHKDLLTNLESKQISSGARVVVNPLSIRGYILAEALAQYDTTMTDIQVVDIPYPAVIEAFADYSIDYVVATEPWTTRLLAQGNSVLLAAARDIQPDMQIGLVTYGPNFLTKAPDVGERFMTAYLQGVRQYNEGKTERNLEIIAQYTALPIDLLESICWGAMHNDGMINIESILTFQEWGVTTGAIDSPVAAEALFEPKFIDYANDYLK